MVNYSNFRKRYYLPKGVKFVIGVFAFLWSLADAFLIFLIMRPSFLGTIFISKNFLVFISCLFFIICFSLLLYMSIITLHNYLEFTPGGVIYKTCFIKLYSPWSNITKIERVTRFRISTKLMLQNRAISTIPFDQGVAQMQAVIERSSFMTRKSDMTVLSTQIPFLLFVPKDEWEEGPLRIYFQYYAPHLLADAS